MKHFFYVASYIYSDGKRFAFSTRVNENTNLCKLAKDDTLEILHPCKTEKQADELAKYWNECYKNNNNLWDII